jgi:DNA-binding IclR family transcriptional regulator
VEETAQTLDRGLRLLQFVADAPGGLTITEAAHRLGVGRAVVYRLAATLVGHGMIRRDAAGQLRIGPGVLQLARRAQPLIADAALPALRRLAEQVGATAHLTVADSGEAVALAVVEPSWTQFHVAYRAGSRHPLDRGAAGRAILAGRSGAADDAEPADADPADAGPADAEPPASDRPQGTIEWIESAGELQSGAYGIAAPVLGVPGLEASVGVVALAPLDPELAGPVVVTAARAVAQALG